MSWHLILAASLPALSTAAVSRDSVQAELDTLVVRESKPFSRQLPVQDIEEKFGIAEDVSDILFSQPGVGRVPESGSLLLVHGESPYDNSFMVRGIPVYSPAHFAGGTQFDRSLLSLSIPVEIDFFTRDFTGVYSGSSASYVNMDPRPLMTEGLAPRPELALTYSSLDAELAASIPLRRGRDRYMFMLKPPDQYRRLLDDLFYASSEEAGLGFAAPFSTSSFRFTGLQRTAHVSTEQLLWFGRDVYAQEVYATLKEGVIDARDGLPEVVGNFPWGIGVVSFTTKQDRPWKASVGGSSQYQYEGKQLGPVRPVKRIKRRNVAGVVGKSFNLVDNLDLTTKLFGEYIDWNGELALHSAHGAVIVGRNGTRSSAQLHAGLHFPVYSWQMQFNTNSGLLGPGLNPFIDVGLLAGYRKRKLSFESSIGFVTTQPDERGFPSPEYARTTMRTYQAYAQLDYFAAPALSAVVNVYCKYRNHLPALFENPEIPLWDETLDEQLLAYGGTFEVVLKREYGWNFTLSQSASRSQVSAGDTTRPHAWDIPWLNKTALSYTFRKPHIGIYLIGTFSGGLPYRELVLDNGNLVRMPQINRTPVYKRLDFKFDWNCRVDGKLVTNLHAYFLLQNFLYIGNGLFPDKKNKSNVREYYWEVSAQAGAGLEKKPIYLHPFDIHLGVRANIRLPWW
ncbi:MAG: hypothetical protein GF398_17865 [Chitinivibrionales bacterium]|nr:hypothetical protein [Chitinivibrionales bacterium]